MNLTGQLVFLSLWAGITVAVFLPKEIQRKQFQTAGVSAGSLDYDVNPKNVMEWVNVAGKIINVIGQGIDMLTKGYDAVCTIFPTVKGGISSAGKEITQAVTSGGPLPENVNWDLEVMKDLLRREFSMIEAMIASLEHKMDQVVVTVKWDAYGVREPLRNPYETAIPRLLQNQTIEQRHGNAIALKGYCYNDNKLSSMVKMSNIAFSCDLLTADQVEIDFEVIWLLEFVASRVNGSMSDSKNKLDIFAQFHSLLQVDAVRQKAEEIRQNITSQTLYFPTNEQAQDYVHNVMPVSTTNSTAPGDCLLIVLLRLYAYNYREVNDVVKILLEDAVSITTTTLVCSTVYSFPNSTPDETMKNLVETSVGRQEQAIQQMQGFFIDAYEKVFQNIIPKVAVRLLDSFPLNDEHKSHELDLMVDSIHRNLSAIMDSRYELSVLLHEQENDMGVKPMFFEHGNNFQRLCDTKFQQRFCLYVNRIAGFGPWMAGARDLLVSQNSEVKAALEAVNFKNTTDATQYLQSAIPDVVRFFPSVLYVIYEGANVLSRSGIRNDDAIFSRYWLGTGSRYVFFMAAGNYTGLKQEGG